MNSLNDAKEFDDPETASSSGVSHVPSQPLSIPSPRGMISRASCLPLDTRSSLGTSGRVFESPPVRDGPSSALFEKSNNLASSSCGLRQRDTGKNYRTGRRLETRAAGFYNTNSSICQERGTLYIVLEEFILKIV